MKNFTCKVTLQNIFYILYINYFYINELFFQNYIKSTQEISVSVILEKHFEKVEHTKSPNFKRSILKIQGLTQATVKEFKKKLKTDIHLETSFRKELPTSFSQTPDCGRESAGAASLVKFNYPESSNRSYACSSLYSDIQMQDRNPQAQMSSKTSFNKTSSTFNARFQWKYLVYTAAGSLVFDFEPTLNKSIEKAYAEDKIEEIKLDFAQFTYISFIDMTVTLRPSYCKFSIIRCEVFQSK